MDRKKALL